MLDLSPKCHAKLSFELLPGRRETKISIESENFDRKLNRDQRNKTPFYFLELIVLQWKRFRILQKSVYLFAMVETEAIDPFSSCSFVFPIQVICSSQRNSSLPCLVRTYICTGMKRKLKETVLKNNVTRPTFGNKTYKLKRSIIRNGQNTFLFHKNRKPSVCTEKKTDNR